MVADLENAPDGEVSDTEYDLPDPECRVDIMGVPDTECQVVRYLAHVVFSVLSIYCVSVLLCGRAKASRLSRAGQLERSGKVSKS